MDGFVVLKPSVCVLAQNGFGVSKEPKAGRSQCNPFLTKGLHTIKGSVQSRLRNMYVLKDHVERHTEGWLLAIEIGNGLARLTMCLISFVNSERSSKMIGFRSVKKLRLSAVYVPAATAPLRSCDVEVFKRTFEP
jgi:hypothetical protein